MRFFFLNYLTWLGGWTYPLVFLAMFIEGEAVLLVLAFAASQGFLSWPWLLAWTITGVLVGDSLWYGFGRSDWKIAKPLHFLAQKVIAPLARRLEQEPFVLILLSKFTYGINHLTLVRTGMLRLPYARFFRIIIVTDLLWVLVIGGLGYFFGASLPILRHVLRYGEVGLLLGLLLVIGLEKLIRRLVDKHETTSV